MPKKCLRIPYLKTGGGVTTGKRERSFMRLGKTARDLPSWQFNLFFIFLLAFSFMICDYNI